MDSISPRPSGLVRRPPRERRGPSSRDSSRSRNPLLPIGTSLENGFRPGRPIVRDIRARLLLDSAILSPHHLVRFAQYAALSGPRAMFFAWRALKLLRRALCLAVFGELPAPLTPCCPKRIRRVCPPDLASTAWLLVGCPGVRLGRLCPLNRSPLFTRAFLSPRSAFIAF